MRFPTLMFIAALALIVVSVVPAFAQSASESASSIPSAVLWISGIAAVLGFLIGSVPPRGENRGWEFDTQGSILWGFAAAAIAGGGTLLLTSGMLFPGALICAVGFVAAIARIIATRPPRVPMNFDLADGINRAEGDDTKSRMKVARKMFHNASFKYNGRYATRSPRVWTFGKQGPDSGMLSMMGEVCQDPHYDTFDILVILVRELPFEPGQPAVIVVRGGNQLRATRVGNGSLTPPSGPALPASSIEAMVGYAWR